MRFRHFEEIDSTNLEAKRMAEAGELGPVWISAQRQINGRGRRGRDWVSKTGNLYCTGLYPHPGNLSAAAQLSFVAALALTETLDQYIDPDLVKIKWPNDVLVDGRKIAGILLESGTTNGHLWVAAGIGVNLTHHPKTDGLKATHLLAHIPVEQMSVPEPVYTGPAPVLATLAASFDQWREVLLNDGFEAVRTAWTGRAVGLGGPVQARLPDKELSGIARGIDENGALLLETKNGTIEKIHAGDVFFSPDTL